jgi:tetratricopeptide (TPR) repeat protein
MTEPLAPEPPLEILMLGSEASATGSAPAPLTPAPRTLSPISPVAPAIRAERWLFVVHLLILVAFAGLVVYFVSLVWRDGDHRPTTDAPAVMLPTALASGTPPLMTEVPAVEKTPPALEKKEPERKEPEKKESLEPAVAPVSGAEEPIPAASRPEPAPPPPAPPAAPAPPRPLVLPGPLLEAAPAVAAVAEEADVIPSPPQEIRVSPEVAAGQKLLEEAASLETSNPALAAERYRKALALVPARTELWKNVADLELSCGANEQAARAYREFLRTHPGRVDALQNLAILDLRNGRTDEARVGLEAAIKAGPSADLYYDLGNLHLKIGNPDGAASAYRRALEYDPRHPEARFNLALVLERIGRRSEAVATLAQTGSVAPDVVRERARMEAMLGGLEAERALGLARGSSDPELVVSVASGFRRAGELEKSLALLDRAVELDPKQATFRLDRGVVRQAMGRSSEAAADYEEAAKLDPSLADAWFNLGVLAEERGRYVSALEQYRAALKADPSLVSAHNNIGTLYLKVGQPAKAVDCFRRCRELDGSFWAARLNLAWGYLAMDARGPAMEELKLYLREVPKDKQNPEAARVLSELERSRSATPPPKN